MDAFSLRRALRTLFSTLFVTIVAIVSLALGIGANAAIFSLFNSFLLRPLPVQEPGRLVNLATPPPKPGSSSCNQAGGCDEVFSYPMFRDLEREQTPFTGIAAHRSFGTNLAYRRQTMTGQGMFVSGSYFGVLGVQPAVGRLIGPNDDRTVGESPLVVLSHNYWRTRDWRRCSRRSGSMACSPTPWRSGRRSLACAWRSVPMPAGSAAS